MSKLKLSEDTIFLLNPKLRDMKLDNFINAKTIPLQFDDIKISLDLEKDTVEVKFFEKGILLASSTNEIHNLCTIQSATFSISHDVILGFIKVSLENV